MKHLSARVFLLISVALLFSGCMTKLSVNPDQIYQGYPCKRDCANFKIGFDQAEDSGYKSTDQCNTLDHSQKLGCLSYVHEYQIDHALTAVVFDSQGRSQ